MLKTSHKERSHHRSLSGLSRRLRVVVIWSFSPVQFHLCTSTWRCLPSFPKQRSGCLLEQKTWSELLCFEHRKASKWQPCVFSELLVFSRESDDLKWANRTWWGAPSPSSSFHLCPDYLNDTVSEPCLDKACVLDVYMNAATGNRHFFCFKCRIEAHSHHHRHHHLIKLDCSVLEVHGDGVI